MHAEQPPPPAVASEERISALDLVRGVAILMILPANVPYFAGFRTFLDQSIRPESPSDRAVHLLTLFFVDLKFITQLAILFGIGLAIQHARAHSTGRPFAWYYLRRMGLLFLLGLAHGLFLWYGDILLTYALVGVMALALSGLGREGTRAVIGVLLGGVLVLSLCGGIMGSLSDTGGDWQRDLKGLPPAVQRFFEPLTPAGQQRIFHDGSYREIVQLHALQIGFFGVIGLFFMYPYLLACFLLGRLFFQGGLFDDPQRRRRRVRHFLLLAAGVGLPFHLVAVALEGHSRWEGLSQLANIVGALPLALGYFGLLLWWNDSGRGTGLQARLRDVGRTALSNYILQSVLCFFLFYSPGLALYGEISRLASLGIVAAIWLGEIALSTLWLRWFSMGPVEWLWRSLAEGRRRPLLRVGHPE